ncbi:phage integrase SAM-like domain-containing protein [Proteiniphilum sp. UBA5384]|uniref:phage integrase SAM-like domain-containing protein n=1 Tax=Proteiniphilum sp. UBA5384 TaxID=1947279 RepID=UPI0025D43471|nr:phage integrase SAM-like domain-containing protein [Proteiniphilum sp. UBA5384]
MATFKPVVFSTKNHIKSDGTTNIKIRVYHNKESQYIPTDYYIKPSFMCSDGTISPIYPDADLFNYELSEVIQKYRKAALKIGSARSSNMSCSEFRDFIVQSVKPDYGYIDFVKFCGDIITSTKKEKTAEWYQQSLKSFLWFYGKDRIDARDITSNKINKWIDQLKIAGEKGRPLRNGAINNYVRGLRALYNACKKEYNHPDHDIILIPNEPFAIDNIPVYKKVRRNITIDRVNGKTNVCCPL